MDFLVVAPTLPTQDQKDALDGSNSPSAANPLVTIADLPASKTFATLLQEDGSTGDNPIESIDGKSVLSVASGAIIGQYADGSTLSQIYGTNANAGFSWTNGTKTGEAYSDVTSTKISHTDLIEFSAASVKKNGFEIATLSSIPYVEIMTGSNTTFGPLDSTTNYIGCITTLSPNASAATRQFELPTGKLKAAWLFVDPTSVLGSNEPVTYNLRNITDGISTLIGTLTYDARGRAKYVSGLSIATDSTKMYSIEIVNPVFATNPTNVAAIAKVVIYP